MGTIGWITEQEVSAKLPERDLSVVTPCYEPAMSTWQLRVGAVQMRSTDDLSANLARCRELTGQAAADGAQLIVQDLEQVAGFLASRPLAALPGAAIDARDHVADDVRLHGSRTISDLAPVARGYQGPLAAASSRSAQCGTGVA